MLPRPLAAAAALVVCTAVAASCSGDDDGSVSTTTTATTAPSPATTEPPATTTTSPELNLAGPVPATETCPAVPAMARPDPARPRYDLVLDVLPEEGAVVGEEWVRFTPDLPTDRLVLRLWANGPRPAANGSELTIDLVRIGDVDVPTEQPDPTTLVVPLADPLAAGERVDLHLRWRLQLPGPTNDRIASEDGAIRLGSFFPILPWEPGVGWATQPPTAGFAEASLAPVADVDLTVSAPPGFTVLASGEELSPGHWRATAMRDVAVSVGRFRVVEALAHAPGPVRVVVGAHDTVPDDPEAYLGRVVHALEDLAGRFGPYPWRTFSLALTPGLGGGIEYPGHVMQGPETIGRTTPHEVGHQWFYALVGNDQGRDPWLDEGLASYAEARVEDTLESEFVSRDVPAAVQGRTGEPMSFWESRQDDYYRGVYVQGAQALAALGDPERVDCALRHYVAVNAFDVATPEDVLAAARIVFPDAGDVLARFGAV